MSDNIHPAHYKLANGVEVIDFIEALGLGAGFELGNAIKYISRLGKKNGEDVKTTIDKAIWYLSRFKDKYVNNSQKMTFFDKIINHFAENLQNQIEMLKEYRSTELVQFAIDFKNIIDFDARQMIEDVAKAYDKNIDWDNTKDIVEWLDSEVKDE